MFTLQGTCVHLPPGEKEHHRLEKVSRINKWLELGSPPPRMQLSPPGWHHTFWYFRGIPIAKPVILLMEETLHHLISSLSHHLQGFRHPRWCRISSINRSQLKRKRITYKTSNEANHFIWTICFRMLPPPTVNTMIVISRTTTWLNQDEIMDYNLLRRIYCAKKLLNDGILEIWENTQHDGFY